MKYPRRAVVVRDPRADRCEPSGERRFAAFRCNYLPESDQLLKANTFYWPDDHHCPKRGQYVARFSIQIRHIRPSQLNRAAEHLHIGSWRVWVVDHLAIQARDPCDQRSFTAHG